MHAPLQLMAESPTVFISFVFVLSLLVGSFLNVVIYRLPLMLERDWKDQCRQYLGTEGDVAAHNASPPTFNLIKPDSTCPHCQHKIRAWENIPVVSWLMLRGKCSQCRQSISIRYPLVELATATLSAVAAWHFGFGPAAAIAIVATWLLLAMTFIDLDTMLLPDQLTLGLLWLALLSSMHNTFVSPSDAILGAALGYLSLWSLYWAFKLLTGKEGMGYGDFKLLAALGALVGWQYLPVVILLSSCVGAAVGLTLIAFKGKNRSYAIPFGPYLAAAGWLCLLYGDWLVAQYWRWILP
ncbi:MAG: prepilin peptidase [Paraglaciecola sp.]|nr:prepilin peptidase [Paraglaciecola sp.]NCT46862.1 prepilin peptidase [Paraglaciecola sp.]